ncbi:hypothetical protein Tco_0054444 [Tanacetum coccineum]
MEVVMTKERISAALVIGTCRVDKGSAAHDVRHCEVNFQMYGDEQARRFCRGSSALARHHTNPSRHLSSFDASNEENDKKAITELAVQFDNASTAKDDLRKAYEKCNDIPPENRALIETFLKQESDKDYEMHLALFRKAAKIEQQMNTKFVRLWEKYN